MALVNSALRETCSVVVALGSERGYCGTWKPQQPFVLRVSFSRCGRLLRVRPTQEAKRREGQSLVCVCVGGSGMRNSISGQLKPYKEKIQNVGLPQGHSANSVAWAGLPFSSL